MPTAEATRLSTITLALIEDSEDVRYLIGAILRRDARFEIVAEAADAESGIEAVLRHQPDAIVLDVGLPDRSGLDILGELRIAAPRTKVVVLTGDHQPASDAAVLAAGAHAYVAKRETTGRLLEVLRGISDPAEADGSPGPA